MKKLYVILTATSYGSASIFSMVFAENKECARCYFETKFPEIGILPITMVYEVESI